MSETPVLFPPWSTLKAEAQADALRRALEAAGGNITYAAELLGVHRSHAMRMLKKHALVEFASSLRLEAPGGVVVLRGPKKGRVMGRPAPRPKVVDRT